MLRAAVKCAILMCLAVVGATSAARTAASCNLRGGYDYGLPDFEPKFFISSGRGAQCAPKLLEISPNCGMSEDPQHGGAWFHCKSTTDTAARPRLSGYWGVWSGQVFEGPAVFETVGGLSTQHLPKHQSARETWLAPVDIEGWHISDGMPYSYGMNEYWRAKEREYIDYYPRTFTKIGPMVRSEQPPFRLATQTLFYTAMNGKERAATTGEAALGCLKVYFVSWTEPKDAEETERLLTSFLEGFRLEPAPLTPKQRKWLCEGP
jgi:hypothetical protein